MHGCTAADPGGIKKYGEANDLPTGAEASKLQSFTEGPYLEQKQRMVDLAPTLIVVLIEAVG